MSGAPPTASHHRSGRFRRARTSDGADAYAHRCRIGSCVREVRPDPRALTRTPAWRPLALTMNALASRGRPMRMSPGVLARPAARPSSRTFIPARSATVTAVPPAADVRAIQRAATASGPHPSHVQARTFADTIPTVRDHHSPPGNTHAKRTNARSAYRRSPSPSPYAMSSISLQRA